MNGSICGNETVNPAISDVPALKEKAPPGGEPERGLGVRRAIAAGIER